MKFEFAWADIVKQNQFLKIAVITSLIALALLGIILGKQRLSHHLLLNEDVIPESLKMMILLQLQTK